MGAQNIYGIGNHFSQQCLMSFTNKVNRWNIGMISKLLVDKKTAPLLSRLCFGVLFDEFCQFAEFFVFGGSEQFEETHFGDA